MFAYCNNIHELNIPNWNTKNVVRMEYTFNNCTNLSDLNIENWNFENVIYLNGFCMNCWNLPTIYISNLNKVAYAINAFRNCYNLEYISTTFAPMGEEEWACNNLINAAYMFANCYNLTSLPFQGDGRWPDWLGPKTKNIDGMFYACNNLKSGMFGLRMIGLMLTRATNVTYKNLNNTNIHSPFYGTNIDYANEGDWEAWDYLQSQGWTC